MAFQTFPVVSATATGPSFPYSEDHAPRVLDAKFGDGYSQQVVDGINTDEFSAEVTWTNLFSSEKDIIINFLSGLKGVTRFYWTPPNPNGTPVQMTFSCPKWKPDVSQANVWTVSATFIRRFDVG